MTHEELLNFQVVFRKSSVSSATPGQENEFCSLALVCGEDHRYKVRKGTRMIKIRRTYVCLVVCVFSVLFSKNSDVLSASSPPTYRVVDLGTLEQGIGGLARGPNAANDV